MHYSVNGRTSLLLAGNNKLGVCIRRKYLNLNPHLFKLAHWEVMGNQFLRHNPRFTVHIETNLQTNNITER